MIDMRQLAEQLAQQDDHLRRTLDGLVTEATPGAEAAALLKIVAEGLLAIHERQRVMTLLIAQIP